MFLVLTMLSCGNPADRDLPDNYRRLDVPLERLESAEARLRGRQLFVEHCALCHGSSGDGHGERSRNLSTAPRDLTATVWQDSTSPRRVFYTIREGVPGTAMPSWKSLSPSECWDLTAFVLSLDDENAR